MNAVSGEIVWLEKVAAAEWFKPGRVAKRRGCSVRQLERITRTTLGKKPGEWLREIQCRKAARLRAQGLRNKEIVAELHFSSESQLCHRVKRVYGKPLREVVLDLLKTG